MSLLFRFYNFSDRKTQTFLEDYPMDIPSMFGSNLPSVFIEENNVKIVHYNKLLEIVFVS